MDSRDRAALDLLDKRTSLGLIVPRPFPGLLTIKQAIGTADIEPNHPVPHDLQSRGRAADAAIVNLGHPQ